MNLLQALPPILGFVGFVIYQLIRPRSSSQQLTARILDKVRAEPGVVENPHYRGLAKKDLLEAIRTDQKLREVVGREDTAILSKAMDNQFQTDRLVHLSLVVFAVAGLLVFARGDRAVDSGGPALAEKGKAPPASERDSWMKPAQFERGTEKHYKADHGRIARDYMARPENVNRLVEAFLKSADRKTLEFGHELTEQLIMGFCPAELTATIEGFDAYPSPDGSTDLNSWVKRIEDVPFRVKVVLDGKPLDVVKTAEWWVLFCGTLEYLGSDLASDCLEDVRKIDPKARHAILLALRGSGLSISDLVARLEAFGVGGARLDRLTRLVTVLPADIKGVHASYAQKYDTFLRELYDDWHTGRSPRLSDSDGRAAVRGALREFVEDLLKGCRLEVARIEGR